MMDRLEAFGLTLVQGGMLAQPHLAIYEFEAVMAARSEVLERKLANQKLKADFAAKGK